MADLVIQRTVRSLGFVAAGVLAIAAFFDAGTLHGGYRLPSIGLSAVPLEELAFYLWYGLWGGLAVLCFAAALFASFAHSLVTLFERCLQKPRETTALLALCVFACALLVHGLFLLGEPITDDELVYQLTARNLALGRLTSVPPVAPEFLQNQFVVVDAGHWHGKYPIGHSLLLAPFELLGRPDLLAPLLGALSVLLTHAVARRFVGARPALLATVLLACSPHFVWTHATLLSQTTSGFMVLLAVYAKLRARESAKHSWLILMSGSLGFLVLTRPLPGVLVAAVVLVDELSMLLRETPRSSWRVLRASGCIALPLMFFAGVLLLANYLQFGNPWSSGYVAVHTGYGLFENIDGELTNSLGGAFVRENVWLFGWPCCFVFLPFARIVQKRGLFWSLIATALAYRVLAPKTVVTTTGPIYMTEIVPWLCMASAAGMVQLEALLKRLVVSHPRERIAAGVAAAFFVAMLAFVPTELRAIENGARRRGLVYSLLSERHVDRALVFANELVVPEGASTWAYYPPSPWPDLRDDIVFLRIPGGAQAVTRARALWREHFADRSAFLFDPRANGNQLQPLSF